MSLGISLAPRLLLAAHVKAHTSLCARFTYQGAPPPGTRTAERATEAEGDGAGWNDTECRLCEVGVSGTRVYGTVVPLAKTNNLGKRRAPVVYGLKERTGDDEGSEKDDVRTKEDAGGRPKWGTGKRRRAPI